MGYYNPILKYGITKFIKDATVAGVDGAIIPDLPIEEADEFRRAAKQFNLNTIFLVSPTTTKEKMRKIAAKSTGFIYYVSLTGVTGARKKLPANIKADVTTLKRYTNKPVCVGFGISMANQVKGINKFADGVIIGSAIIKKIEANLCNKNKIIYSVKKLIHKLLKGHE